jgi:hypothetical protein
LLTWWLKDSVGKLFKESFNMYGYTAEKLFYDGKMAREGVRVGVDWGEAIQKPWFVRARRERRAWEKQQIWKRLLGNRARRGL